VKVDTLPPNLRCFASEPSPRRSFEFYWSQINGRLRTLESIQTWRALLAISMGSGPSWMAYRMLCHGVCHPRGQYRHPFRGN
jgi:hypothetical protein